MLALILLGGLQASAPAEPLRSGCSATDKTIASVDSMDRMEVLLALSGDQGTCYKVRVAKSGQTLTGYVRSGRLPAVEAFVHERQRVSQALSAAQARPAAAPPPNTAAIPRLQGVPAQFENFSGPDDSGKIIGLSDVHGRATLVTFWSPDSARSRNQLLPILPLYQNLHRKGLTAIGVSMNPDPAAIGEALDDIHVQWPQVADTHGLARRYHVDPRAGEIFVLDASRNIVAAGPMGEDIVNAVRKLLASQ